jgi:hypothetical protein
MTSSREFGFEVIFLSLVYVAQSFSWSQAFFVWTGSGPRAAEEFSYTFKVAHKFMGRQLLHDLAELLRQVLITAVLSFMQQNAQIVPALSDATRRV